MYSWPSRSRQVVWKSLQWSRLKNGSQCNLVVGGWTESQSNSGAVQHIRFVVVSCHSTIINNTTKKVESERRTMVMDWMVVQHHGYKTPQKRLSKAESFWYETLV